MTTTTRSQSVVSRLRDRWREDHATRKAAAVSFFAVLSFAPAMVLTVALLRWLFGEQFATQQFIDRMSSWIGTANAQAFNNAVQSASDGGWLVTIISLLSLALAAASVVVQLKEALNEIWNVERQDEDPGEVAKKYVRAFFIILGVGIVMVLLVAGSTTISGIQRLMTDITPGANIAAQVASLAVTALVAALVYAVIYRYLPDAPVRWSSVWGGAIAAGVLFSLGTGLVAWYLNNSPNMQSSVGLFGSIIVVMVWVFYSTIMLFLGAEMARERAVQQVARSV